MPAKIHKLQEQSKNDYRRKISDIFSGVSIFVNGYTSKLTCTEVPIFIICLSNDGNYKIVLIW